MDKPEIDWKKAPKGDRWWAADENGEAHWYMTPDIAPFTNFWFAAEKVAPRFGFVGDWRSSLTERPD